LDFGRDIASLPSFYIVSSLLLTKPTSLPFQEEATLELASRYYREILMTFMKADRYLKPSWPQHLQQVIFDIKGVTSPLHLPSGEDLGGLKRSLDAYCSTFDCEPVKWVVNWKAHYAPEFCVLPADDPRGYSYLQLLAVFRALRFNDYFKSLSFRDVDFSCLLNRKDIAMYEDSIADVNRHGELAPRQPLQCPPRN
jgi:hypothetical protein